MCIINEANLSAECRQAFLGNLPFAKHIVSCISTLKYKNLLNDTSFMFLMKDAMDTDDFSYVIGSLNQLDLLNNANLQLLFDNAECIHKIRWIIHPIEQHAKPFSKDVVASFLLNLQYVNELYECFNELTRSFSVNWKNIESLLANPANAKTIFGDIQKKKELRKEIRSELYYYLNNEKSESRTSSIRFFDYADVARENAATMLREFIDTDRDMLTSQDIIALTEPDSFLLGIVSRCRDGGIELPESLAKKVSNLNMLKKSQ